MTRTGGIVLVGLLLLGACNPTRLQVTGGGGSGGGVGGGGSSSTETGGNGGTSTSAPSPVLTLCPASGAQQAGTNTVVRVHSTVPIDPATVTQNSLVVLQGGAKIGGQVTVDGEDLTFRPGKDLPPDLDFHVVLDSGVKDVEGASLAVSPLEWDFGSGTGPSALGAFVFSVPTLPPKSNSSTLHEIQMNGETALLAWTNFGVPVVSATVDEASFTPPLTVLNPSSQVSDQLSFSLADGKAHLAWADFGGGAGSPGGVVNYVRMDPSLSMPPDSGKTLSSLPEDSSYVPTVAAAPDGRVAMIWSIWGKYDVIATSQDQGVTFSPPVKLDVFLACTAAVFIDGHLVVAGMGSENQLYVTSADDGGMTFAPAALLSTSADCPRIVDNGLGQALVVWQEGFESMSTHAATYDPGTLAVGGPIEVVPAGGSEACSRIGAAGDGRLALVRSDYHTFKDDAVTTIRLSEYDGKTFGAPQTIDVIDGHGLCPGVGYAPSGVVHLAWQRDEFQLMTSLGVRKRPCE